jgi:hypothetical protein
MREHEVVIVALEKARNKIVSRVSVNQTFYGMCFSPDGKKLYASGGEFEVVHEFDFTRGLLGNPKTIDLKGIHDKLIVGGLAIDKNGRDLFIAGTWGDVVVRVPIDNPDNKVTIHIAPGCRGCGRKLQKANLPVRTTDARRMMLRKPTSRKKKPILFTLTPSCPTRTANAPSCRSGPQKRSP